MSPLLDASSDKSGLSPNTISLPSGPGSVEGLGEAFQFSPNTGTASHSVSIRLPPGPVGHAPSLALVYDGGTGKSTLGHGWSLPVPFVQRQTDKGIPRYVDAPDGNPDRFIDGRGEELVPVADGGTTSYFARIESGFVRYRRVGDHWEGTRRDGTRLIFGKNASSRLSDPAAPSKVFRWLLEKEIDPRGNTIRYRYGTFPGETNSAQVYLKAVEYGPGAPPWGGGFHFATFLYEARADWFEDCRAGFPVRTGMRMSGIDVGTQGVSLPGHLAGDFNDDGTEDALNRRYVIDYQAGAPHSLVSAVTVFGTDGTSSLPPARFGYTGGPIPSSVSAASGWISANNAPALVFDHPSVDFIDLNGDGLPDLLRAGGSGGAHQVFFNQGESIDGGQRVIRWSSPEDVETTAGVGNPWNLGLQQNEVVLADVDGDGLADLIQMTAHETYYFPSSPPGDGSARWGARRALEAEDFIPPSPFGSDASVRTLDADFDKRADIIRSIPVGGGFAYQIWFNRGEEGFSARVTVEPETGYDLGAPGVRIADMNGDRLQDIAWIRPTQVLYTANLGNGNWLAEHSIPIPDETLTTEQIARSSLRDVNGNGLADLVVERPEPQSLWIWLNQGNRTFGERIVVTGLPASYGPTTAVRWVDLNGNGTVDMVFADSGMDAEKRIRAVDLGRVLGCEPRPWLLNRIENGIGRVDQFVYETSTRYLLADGAQAGGYRYAWPHPLPFPMEVISETRTSDSLGGDYVARFSYHDGYYDPNEKQFRGFARVVREDLGDATAPSLFTEMIFNTGASDDAMKGKLLGSTTKTAGGGVFSSDQTYWEVKNLYPGMDERQVRFAHERLSVSDIVELGNGEPKRIETEYGYDLFGNLIEIREFGVVEDGDQSAWDDERTIRRTFSAQYPDNVTKWMLSYPVTETIESLEGTVVAESRWFYDDESFSGTNSGAVSKGNLTLLRRAIDPATGSFISAQRQTYDAFGNPVHLIDALGTGPGAPHSRTIAYDPSLHTHPVSETIHIGGAVAAVTLEADYDLGLGQLTNSQDFNGHETFYKYDPFGRLTSITKPGDTLAAPTESYDFRLGMALSDGRTINWIETRQRESAGGGTVDSRTFFDGLGRKVMRRAEGEEPGQIVVSDTVVFNDRRTEWKKYLPYFEQGTLDWADPGFSTPFQECVYDALGRQVRLYQPDTGNGRSFAETTYGPLTRLVRDEEQTNPASPHHGAGMRYIEDGLRDDQGSGRLRVVEEIVKVDENGEPTATPQTWTTRYRYDTLGNFTGYTDSRDNEKSMHYDGLSRRVFMQDPNRGPYWWAFDAAGNVLCTCDAKGQQIAYSYDGANRITAEWHLVAPEAAATPPPAPGSIWENPPAAPTRTPEVAFHYDVPADPLAQEGFWRPMEAIGTARVILEKSPLTAAADVNDDGVVDVRDIALRAAADTTGPNITATNTLGRLAWVADQAGDEHLSYDARGRASWKVKRFNMMEFDNPLSFYVENTYDSMDRLTRHIYADGTHVDYNYNSRGLLESVTGAFSEVNYNPSGQNARIALVNGVVTDFLYDPRLRVERITSSRTADGLALQDREFSYDDVSNITGIQDQRSTSARAKMISEAASSSGLSPTDLDDSFSITYDSLYRMTSATGPGQGTHGYRFDKIGNMLAQTYGGDPRFRPESTGTLQYGGPGRGPQALARAVSDQGGPDTDFGYDSNGNLTTITHGDTTASKEWDPKDRLVAASEGGIANTHTYDYASKRVIHRQTRDGGDPRLTLYIDDVSEFRDGRLVKYIYVGSEKVARSDFSAAPGTPVVPDTFFLHDHLGSTLVAMDPAAAIHQISSYAPYGRNRFTGIGGSSAIDYGFSGKESHDGPDLAYFETRFLSSSQARFTQPDTLTLNPPDRWKLHPQKWHPYSYTWGNPMTMVDLDGRDAQLWLSFGEDLKNRGAMRFGETLIGLQFGKAGDIRFAQKIANGSYENGWDLAHDSILFVTGKLPKNNKLAMAVHFAAHAASLAGATMEMQLGSVFVAYGKMKMAQELAAAPANISSVNKSIPNTTIQELFGNDRNGSQGMSRNSLYWDQPFDKEVVRPYPEHPSRNSHKSLIWDQPSDKEAVSPYPGDSNQDIIIR